MTDPREALVALAEALTRAADRCCQCTDGHHDQMPPYGTDDDVRISRDDARKIAAALLPGHTEDGVKAEALREVRRLARGGIGKDDECTISRESLRQALRGEGS